MNTFLWAENAFWDPHEVTADIKQSVSRYERSWNYTIISCAGKKLCWIEVIGSPWQMGKYLYNTCMSHLCTVEEELMLAIWRCVSFAVRQMQHYRSIQSMMISSATANCEAASTDRWCYAGAIMWWGHCCCSFFVRLSKRLSAQLKILCQS